MVKQLTDLSEERYARVQSLEKQVTSLTEQALAAERQRLECQHAFAGGLPLSKDLYESDYELKRRTSVWIKGQYCHGVDMVHNLQKGEHAIVFVVDLPLFFTGNGPRDLPSFPIFGKINEDYYSRLVGRSDHGETTYATDYPLSTCLAKEFGQKSGGWAKVTRVNNRQVEGSIVSSVYVVSRPSSAELETISPLLGQKLKTI